MAINSLHCWATMAPKPQEILGDVTPDDAASTDKKKDDTTPTPIVDKDVTPSEDDKKKKDVKDTASLAASSSKKKGTTGTTSSRRGTNSSTQHTELTELSPSRAASLASGKRKDIAGGRGKSKKKHPFKTQVKMNKSLKHLRSVQKKKAKSIGHPRSFQSPICRILRSINDGQMSDGMPSKRVSPLAMMILDSFTNDLCDKIISAAVELLKNTGRRQLGSNEIKAAMKLVLPIDMADCAEEAMSASLANFKENTSKYASGIDKVKANKRLADEKD